nr:hypothetical protein GCM10025732_31600 [Glycomyces mayteni]
MGGVRGEEPAEAAPADGVEVAEVDREGLGDLQVVEDRAVLVPGVGEQVEHVRGGVVLAPFSAPPRHVGGERLDPEVVGVQATPGPQRHPGRQHDGGGALVEHEPRGREEPGAEPVVHVVHEHSVGGEERGPLAVGQASGTVARGVQEVAEALADERGRALGDVAAEAVPLGRAPGGHPPLDAAADERPALEPGRQRRGVHDGLAVGAGQRPVRPDGPGDEDLARGEGEHVAVLAAEAVETRDRVAVEVVGRQAQRPRRRSRRWHSRSPRCGRGGCVRRVGAVAIGSHCYSM